MNSPMYYNFNTGGSPVTDNQLNTNLGGELGQSGLRQSKPGNDFFRYGLADAAPGARAGLQFGSGMEPWRQMGITQLMGQLSNPWASVQALRDHLMAGGTLLGQQQANQLAAHGGGIGTQQGAILGATNAANHQANDMASYMGSPEGVTAQGNAMNALASSAYGPGAGIANQFAQEAEGARAASAQRSAAHQQGGLLGGVMPLLGSLIPGGGGLGGILGAMGGGGGGYSTGGVMGDQSLIPPGGTSNWNGSVGVGSMYPNMMMGAAR